MDKYFTRHKHYKKEVEGIIVNSNNNSFGIEHRGGLWIITDIKSGLAIKQFKTKKEALSFIDDFDIDKHKPATYDKVVKEFEQLEPYDENKVYISEKSNDGSITYNFTGEYKGQAFKIHIEYDKIGMEYSIIKGNYSDDEAEQLANKCMDTY